MKFSQVKHFSEHFYALYTFNVQSMKIGYFHLKNNNEMNSEKVVPNNMYIESHSYGNSYSIRNKPL